MIRSGFIPGFLVVLLILNSGCMTRGGPSAPVSYRISISTQADAPVSGELTVKTESMGRVNLDRPLLSAEFAGGMLTQKSPMGIPMSQSQWMDLCQNELGPERVVQLTPMMFLNREGVNGMEEDAILEALGNEALDPGNEVFMTVETDQKRAVFKLKTTWLDHPDHVYLQSDLGETEWDFSVNMFEIHPLKEAGDSTSAADQVDSPAENSWAAMILWKGSPDTVVEFEKEPLFTVMDLGMTSGLPNRFKIIRDKQALLEMGYSAETVESLSDRHVWKNADQTCPPDEQIRAMHGRHVVVTWKEPRKSQTFAMRALFWSRTPGLQFEMDQPWRLEEIKRDLRSLGIPGLRWSSIDYEEGGTSITGGSL
jgi:hypothetical protein